ncbi:hypothetical protein [Stackebrandtia nassauensis]|uniref:hypothetical protein n=1 Tax=Stackebrandtia nassauensis TaxID=283811 RepID=UPI0001A39F0C|nr:hypothetical protein [Stackebrandtia nassauensis]
MSMGKSFSSCWLAVLGVVAVVGFGVAGCSSGGGKADSKKPEASGSPSTTKELDYAAIAEEALVSPDLEALSDYMLNGTNVVADPWGPCVEDAPQAVDERDRAQRTFQGKRMAMVTSTGLALAGSVDDAMGELRELWLSKECESFEGSRVGLPGSEEVFDYERVKKLKAPKGVDDDSWVGVCVDGRGKTAADSPTGQQLTGQCLVVYVSGKHSISEVSADFIPGLSAGVKVPSFTLAECAKTVTRVAAAAVAD